RGVEAVAALRARDGGQSTVSDGENGAKLWIGRVDHSGGPRNDGRKVGGRVAGLGERAPRRDFGRTLSVGSARATDRRRTGIARVAIRLRSCVWLHRRELAA